MVSVNSVVVTFSFPNHLPNLTSPALFPPNLLRLIVCFEVNNEANNSPFFLTAYLQNDQHCNPFHFFLSFFAELKK
jgi:hypothetical protein